MTTPNRPPLWEVMRDAYDRAPMPPVAFRNCDDIVRFFMAAEIRALQDWLIQQCRNEGIDQDARNGIYKMLTAEVDRAERGDD
jgi:hypothetical protein